MKRPEWLKEKYNKEIQEIKTNMKEVSYHVGYDHGFASASDFIQDQVFPKLIDSAPKDGTVILGVWNLGKFSHACSIQFVTIDGDSFWRSTDNLEEVSTPRFWARMPDLDILK